MFDMAGLLYTEDELIDAIGLVSKMDDDGGSRGRHGAYQLNYQERYKDTDKLPQLLPFFIPDSSSFQQIHEPGTSDWLGQHQETAQTFHHYLETLQRGPSEKRHVIYLQPFTIQEDAVPKNVLQAVRTYTEIFFGMDAQILPELSLKGVVPERINQYSKSLQVNAKFVMVYLKTILPNDAFCIAGVTLCDLYPRDEWNFVFGVANQKLRCGVYSLARYLDNFGENETSTFDIKNESQLLYRSCKTLCHEIGHMFGLAHCVFYQCLMNGSNHLEESDSRPIFLCPVCLRKLHFSCRFDMHTRYQKMLHFWDIQHRQNEVNWLMQRLVFLQDSCP